MLKLYMIPFQLVLLVFLLYTINGENIHASTYTVIEGHSIVLGCQRQDNQSDGYVKRIWLYNGHPLKNSSHIYQDDKSLNINHITKKEHGKYTCITVNEHGLKKKMIAKYLLHITWLHSVSVHLQPTKYKEHIILRCHINGNGDFHIEWLKNNMTINQSSISAPITDRNNNNNNETEIVNSLGSLKSNIIINDNKLIIKKPNENDSGTYKCLARTQKNSNPEKYLSLQSENDYVLKFERKSLRNRNRNSNGKKKLHIRCSYKNEKESGAKNGGGNISNSTANNDHHNTTGTTVTENILNSLDHLVENIHKINLENEIFLCRDKRGDKLQDNFMNANDISTLIKNENDHAVLDCVDGSSSYIGKSNIIIKWLKDGNLIKQIDHNADDGNNIIGINMNNTTSTTMTTTTTTTTMNIRDDARISINRKNYSLIITSLINSDHGLYECKIINYKNNDDDDDDDNDGDNDEHYKEIVFQHKIELKIIEQLKFVPQPTSKHLEIGQIGKVHCKVQGTPQPQVQWYKEISMKLPSGIEDINGTLTFKNVSTEDRGNYTCTARNTQGQINATIFINPGVAPRFLIAPKGPIHYVHEMATTMIHCQAIGDPKPTVQWDKDLEYLNNNNNNNNNNSSEVNRYHILPNGTLHFTEVHMYDEGEYGCTIGNSAGLKREAILLFVKPAEEFTTEESDGFIITRAVCITMSVAFAYIILVIGLTLWCRHKRQARKARISMLEKEIVENGGGDCHGDGGATDNGNCSMGKNGEIEPCLGISSVKKNKSKTTNGTTKDTHKSGDDTGASVTSKISKKLTSNFDSITISRSSLYELVQIGRGEFGDVFIGKIKKQDIKNCDEYSSSSINSTTASTTKLLNDEDIGTAVEDNKNKSKISLNEIIEIKEDCSANNSVSLSDNILDNSEFKQVLVKALNKIKDENACTEFRRQIDLFRSIQHQGVARLYGLCREKDPHYLVLEYTDWGDLKQFLLATAGKSSTATVNDAIKPSGDGDNNKLNKKKTTTPPPLNMPQFLCIAHQIARGMDAIYRVRFIHKDLATRNCIITSNFITKITYPALTKDKYQLEYYKHKNALLPIRWMSPECLQEDDYSTKSDVYAFGVLIWELFTCSVRLPFENELKNDEFILKLQNGTIEWKLPDNVPDELQTILISCWNINPKDRPTFSQLCSAIGKCIKNNRTMQLKE